VTSFFSRCLIPRVLLDSVAERHVGAVANCLKKYVKLVSSTVASTFSCGSRALTFEHYMYIIILLTCLPTLKSVLYIYRLLLVLFSHLALSASVYYNALSLYILELSKVSKYMFCNCSYSLHCCAARIENFSAAVKIICMVA